jgi:very-short-patch-repair endonuclease
LDGEREEWLEAQGIVVLRFWNNQVFDELDAVLEAIWAACRLRATEMRQESDERHRKKEERRRTKR